MTLRIAILVHGHPAYSAGGTENAAYGLFQQMIRHPEVEPLLVAVGPPDDPAPPRRISHFLGRSNEWLVRTGPLEGVSLASIDPAETQLLVEHIGRAFKPDIVHIQHFLGFGVQIFSQLRSTLRVPIVCTLHEFLAICHRDGQMLRPSGALCEQDSPVACGRCFPDIGRAAFYVRRNWMASQLEAVDAFVAPSQFLAERYRLWAGWQGRRLSIIDNILPESSSLPVETCWPHVQTEGLVRIGFFGRYTPLKGIQVLLEACDHLAKPVQGRLQIGLHGGGLANHPSVFVAQVRALMKKHKAYVADHGSYVAADAQRLMRCYDWIVVPSIWWENSPMVMSEAAAAGRPVICGNIGGMAEKIANGMRGVTFEVGSPRALAGLLSAIVEGRVTLPPSTAASSKSEEQILDQHLALYESLRQERRAGP